MKNPDLIKLEALAIGLTSGKLSFDEVEPNLSTQELLLLGGLLSATMVAAKEDWAEPVSVTREAAQIECDVLDEIENGWRPQ